LRKYEREAPYQVSEIVGKKTFFSSFFDLAIVNARVVHQSKFKKYTAPEFCENATEGLVCDVGKEIIEQPTTTSVGRLVGKNDYAYKVPAIHFKDKGQSQRTCKVCADTSKH
jgi:hypothetical protein